MWLLLAIPPALVALVRARSPSGTPLTLPASPKTWHRCRMGHWHAARAIIPMGTEGHTLPVRYPVVWLGECN